MTAAQPSIVVAWKDRNGRLLASLMFLIGLAVEISRVARDTFFLQTAGADQIPFVYIAFSLLMIVCSVIYSTAARRISLEKLASVTLGIAATVVGIEWILVLLGSRSHILAYTLFCSVEMFFIFVPLTVWAIANQIFRLEDGEVLLPSIATYGLIGTVSGGLLARIISPYIGPYNTLTVAAVAFGIGLFLSRKILVPPEQINVNESEDSTPETKIVSERKNRVWSEEIVRTLTFLAFPMWVLVYMIEYTYYATMGRVFTSANDLSSFLSVFVSVCSLVALLVQVQITPWLVSKLGIGTTCFIYPASLAIGALSTLAFALIPGESVVEGVISLPVMLVLFARFLDMALYQSVYESSVHVLYYAVPRSRRTQARALVGGIIFPASIAWAGLILLGFRYTNEPIYNIAFTAVSVGFLVLIMAMDIRPDYLRSLLTRCDPKNSKLKAALILEISHLSLNESRNILVRSLLAENRNEALFAAEKLAERYDESLLEDLVELKGRVDLDVIDALVSGLPEGDVRAVREQLVA